MVYEPLEHPNFDVLRMQFTAASTALLDEEIALLGREILIVIFTVYGLGILGWLHFFVLLACVTFSCSSIVVTNPPT